jgi:hypothetical protein
MATLYSKVMAALGVDFVELSNCRVNGRSIVVESVKKTPRHVPETWNACYHIQLGGLTVASIEVYVLPKSVKLILQRYTPNYNTDRCKAHGKPIHAEIGPRYIQDQLNLLVLEKLSEHVRKIGQLPPNSRRFPHTWSVMCAAKTVQDAKDAFLEAIRDLDASPEQCNINGNPKYALTLRHCPSLRKA